MSNLSANTLFHFTKKKYLLNIISGGFLPRYSKEFDPELKDNYLIGDHMYIPMVSFCDIPMSMVKEHTKVYNSYGIGLKKSWGIQKHLNPVFYVQKNSIILENLVSAIHEYMLLNMKFEMGKISIKNEETLEKLLDTYSYLKPYICGGKYRGKYENYSYYNEKEWRYIPSLPNEKKHLRRIFDSLTEDEREMKNQEISEFSLLFKSSDINYIIVNKISEIDNIMYVAKKSNQYSCDDLDYIRTTFLLTERIVEDF